MAGESLSGRAARAGVLPTRRGGKQRRPSPKPAGKSTGPPAWSEPAEALCERLGTTPQGLSEDAARARLDSLGANTAEARRRHPLALELLQRLGNPLVLVLLVACGVSAVVHDLTSSAIIAVIVLISVTLDFVQEHRANNAAERLRSAVALRARVLRDGEEQERPAVELVPGDVVLLAAGSLVPADARLLESRELSVNEALLTGEPYPMEKATGLAAADAPLAEVGNTVFAGTSVLGGTARALVFATGGRTEVGSIARGLEEPVASTAFARDTRRFSVMLMRLTVLMVLFVLLVNLVLERPLLESFLFAVALAVGLTPELLPMVVSVTLARGALRLAGQGVIVKRLSAVHDLGCMDVLCTDKTGTLTEARIRMERAEDAAGHPSPRVRGWAFLNSHFATGLRSPMDAAILDQRLEWTEGWDKQDELPFDFERRRVSVLLQRGARRVLVVKGAPEALLRLCEAREDADGAVRPLDPEAREALQARSDAMGEEGLRVLGIAWRDEPPRAEPLTLEDEARLVFAGFVTFLDPPKQSARPALDALAREGVAVKVVTGDNARVAVHVCQQLGLDVRGVLSGAELALLDDEALSARAQDTTVFARASPAQKGRILRALRQRGHVVGYLGDGINDAPSLHEADVGISVEGAVDVAREAAALLMLRQELGVLHSGVLEGRRTFGNVMKYIRMGTSSNFGNMLSMAVASLALPFLPMLPIQILLNNMLYDVSELAIPLDTVDAAQLARPTRWDLRFVRLYMAVFGTLSSLFDAATFVVLLHGFRAGAPLFQTSWFMESLTTQVLVIFIIRTRGGPGRAPPSRVLLLSSLGMVLVANALPFTPVGHYFGFVRPPPSVLLSLGVLVALYLGCAAWLNRWFFRHFDTS
ncbi:magnesium-translocating P-type ATPase [Corallococcus silvisoli]|uniref:magnesium-translocating P-type ATPase n=1 Tax=Corallococcus silvisoli TaxID=2697031 RepID=UPI001377774C|nr:magnesium-translocating P-type ATPase [Corallococcus silvisoli]NBD09625.1 magnesium-translocating P-type ATPase [Corallococcus silvisoli]